MFENNGKQCNRLITNNHLILSCMKRRRNLNSIGIFCDQSKEKKDQKLIYEINKPIGHGWVNVRNSETQLDTG